MTFVSIGALRVKCCRNITNMLHPNFKIQGSYCSWAGQYEFLFVADPEDHFTQYILTRDPEAAGLSFTGVTTLWSLSKTHLS